MMRNSIYIDLGTANTLVMERRRGLLANEPSVIAYRTIPHGKRTIVAVGSLAKEKLGRTSGDLVASHPLKEGVIAELDATQAMLKYFLASSKSWMRPTLVISLPYGVSDIEKDAVRDCALAAGANEVKLIEEPMAAAIGSGLDVKSPRGSMILDIGGGTTEAAIISLYGIVHCEAVRIGGHAFDNAIVDYVRKHFNLMIGEPSAERVKIEIGSAVRGFSQKTAPVRGVDFTTGLPREVILTSDQVHEALDPSLREIVRTVQRALEKTPPDLVSDINERGIVIAGGGALIGGIAERLSHDLGLTAVIADDPLLAIARGGHRSLHDGELLSRIVLS
jgi:rod shape-determining protein MreB